MSYKTVAAALVLFSVLAADEVKPVIKMGYRTTEKLPYIEEAPNNSGLFRDLYSEAARRIGYELEIVRIPKKRVLMALEKGELDFYPGFSFTEERAEYAFWMINGIKQRDVAISMDTLQELRQFSDVKGLRYLVALGNPDYFEGEDLSGLKIHTVAELDVGRAIEMLKLGRVDFYVYEEDTMKFYVKSNRITGMKFHNDLIKRFYWMQAGFSRLSPHYKGVNNPDYDSTGEMSRENFPYELVTGSTLDRFRNALKEMADEGYTDSLYRFYFE